MNTIFIKKKSVSMFIKCAEIILTYPGIEQIVSFLWKFFIENSFQVEL